ncbi:MAG: PKD domain-containing protein, partial [Planctomycetota bacterium]
MERITSLRWPAGLLTLVLILAGDAAAQPPADHTTSEHGYMHAEDKDYPARSHCTDCHGSDILGGIGPSCYECHTDYWRYFDPADVTPPLDHTIVRGGRQHKPGHLDPFNSGCTLCHGENLDDGFAPSCFTCHGELWGSGNGPPANHTELRGGFAEHKPGLGTPFQSKCTDCHGANLNNGFATSCFTCHGSLWAGGGPPQDHTEQRDGYADHKPGLGDPIASGCTQCHGPNLNNGFAPSCFTCHGDYWSGGSGPPADHTEQRDGYADHKPGLGDPIANGCTTCHGPNLDDGFATSCFTCHEPIWAGSGPPSDHTEVMFGFAEHKPGYDDPIANGCTQCHGPGLDDGFATSCFTCHGNLWSGNSPPMVDTGGPYTSSPGEPIELDASATSDADDDPLTYEWLFGDGSPVESSGSNPKHTHTYTQAGTYNGSVMVDDGVNPAVIGAFTVEVGDNPPGEDVWEITTTNDPPEAFTISIEDHQGSLVIVKDDGVNTSLAYGVEFVGVIF